MRHTICLLEALVTLKKLISVSLTVYLDVRPILCNSNGTFQKSVCCPCHCEVTLLILLTVLLIIANLDSGFETYWSGLCRVAFAADRSVGKKKKKGLLIYCDADLGVCLHGFIGFMSIVCLQPSNPTTLLSADSVSLLESCW